MASGEGDESVAGLCQSRGWFFYWFGQPVKNMVDGVVAMVGVGVVEVVVVAMVVVVVVGMFAGVA